MSADIRRVVYFVHMRHCVSDPSIDEHQHSLIKLLHVGLTNSNGLELPNRRRFTINRAEIIVPYCNSLQLISHIHDYKDAGHIATAVVVTRSSKVVLKVTYMSS